MQVSAEPIDFETCPVPDSVLRRLLGNTLSVAAELGAELPETQRAALAVFCYRRAHMRPLGLVLAKKCDRRALVREAGLPGELIHVQALSIRDTDAADIPLARNAKRPVSLHTF